MVTPDVLRGHKNHLATTRGSRGPEVDLCCETAPYLDGVPKGTPHKQEVPMLGDRPPYLTCALGATFFTLQGRRGSLGA